jgi:hypothetical protein
MYEETANTQGIHLTDSVSNLTTILIGTFSRRRLVSFGSPPEVRFRRSRRLPGASLDTVIGCLTGTIKGQQGSAFNVDFTPTGQRQPLRQLNRSTFISGGFQVAVFGLR